ncbi:hypothetical protein M408DRAFT_331839, partial [Serendipita vermifera MAFF 305830]
IFLLNSSLPPTLASTNLQSKSTIPIESTLPHPPSCLRRLLSAYTQLFDSSYSPAILVCTVTSYALFCRFESM